MIKKLIVIMVCILFIIAAIEPLMGKLTLAFLNEKKNPEGITPIWISLPQPHSSDMLLERTICRRMSFHTGYPATPVTDEELSSVLWAAYGVTTTGGRTIYSPNGTYSTTIYVIRSDATYIYVAANHSLRLWKTGNYLHLGQDTGAPIKFGMIWNRSISPDEKAGMAEIGMIAQNVYFEANALDLATLTTGMSVNDLNQLGLSSNEKPEIIMHLGHLPDLYDFIYDPLPASNLPLVINNTVTLADAVTFRQIVNNWNTTELSLLEESQILWCSYGTSYLFDKINNRRHRTLPSAMNVYPFKIYAVNQSGVYQYTPETHSISMIVSGDKRELIRNAVENNNISITSSPWIIIPFWDTNKGSQRYIQWWWYEAGAIVHNILLEATALNLGGNVVSVITDQNALRSALGLTGQTNLVAMDLVMVGYINGSSKNYPPSTPTLLGPSNGKRGMLYNYSVSAVDSDGDDVFYFIDWGDGTNSGWMGGFKSGEEIQASHIWDEKGTYCIRSKARDGFNAQSGWATLTVTMPVSYNIPRFLFWEQLFQRFPNAFPILRQMCGY
jgi:SagB-type dehydrogenase family enzyme